MANVAHNQTRGRTPQDHLPKQTTRDNTESLFSFYDDDGTEHVATCLLSEVITPGVLRRNRTDEFSLYCELVEALYDGNPEAMAAIDSSWETLKRVVNDLQDAMKAAGSKVGATLGESTGSST